MASYEQLVTAVYRSTRARVQDLDKQTVRIFMDALLEAMSRALEDDDSVNFPRVVTLRPDRRGVVTCRVSPDLVKRIREHKEFVERQRHRWGHD